MRIPGITFAKSVELRGAHNFGIEVRNLQCGTAPRHFKPLIHLLARFLLQLLARNRSLLRAHHRRRHTPPPPPHPRTHATPEPHLRALELMRPLTRSQLVCSVLDVEHDSTEVAENAVVTIDARLHNPSTCATRTYRLRRID